MKKIFVSLMLVVLLLPVMVGAQITRPDGNVISGDENTVLRVINTIINWLFWALVVAAVFVVIWAAFTFLTAAGDPEKVAKARNLILYAIVAIVVAFLAEGIVFLVSKTILGTGVNYNVTE